MRAVGSCLHFLLPRRLTVDVLRCAGGFVLCVILQVCWGDSVQAAGCHAVATRAGTYAGRVSDRGTVCVDSGDLEPVRCAYDDRLHQDSSRSNHRSGVAAFQHKMSGHWRYVGGTVHYVYRSMLAPCDGPLCHSNPDLPASFGTAACSVTRPVVLAATVDTAWLTMRCVGSVVDNALVRVRAAVLDELFRPPIHAARPLAATL